MILQKNGTPRRDGGADRPLSEKALEMLGAYIATFMALCLSVWVGLRPAPAFPRSRHLATSILAAALLCLCACSPGTEPARIASDGPVPAVGERDDAPAADGEPLPPGHRRMLEALAEIARRTPDEHFYLGDKTARQIRRALRDLAADASAQGRWKLHHQAGVVELRLGNARDAVEHFSAAYRLLPEADLSEPWENRTRFDLALAYLRLGEIENCCERGTPQSCILPLEKGALHTRPEGSKKAAQFFLEILTRGTAEADLQLASRWLLNVAYMTLGEYPGGVPPEHLVPPRSFDSEVALPRFENVAPRLGLDTFDLSGGAIVDDFDGDDYLDIIASTWDTSGQMRFFRNNRDGSFTDRTAAAGLTGLFGGLNTKQADYDNDGHLDILVLRGAWLAEAGRHPNSLLRNRGGARFTDVTFEAGLADVNYPTQTAEWADYDNDGDLDLYIGNEHTPRLSAPSQLFQNNGDGTFTDVAAQAGVENRGYTKGVSWGDFDGDRYVDLYVSNFRGANRLYRNNADGTFTDVAPELAVTEPEVSFPVWFWDFDSDGVLDIYVSSYEGRVARVAAYHLGEPVKEGVPCLYRGDGRGGFEEVARAARLTQPILPMGSNYGDLNGDGYLDFYLGTGDPDFASLMPNLLFVNQGGRSFADATTASGLGHLQKGHGVAFADLDNDGDLDVFQQMGGAFRGDAFANALYENPGFGTRWITVKLVGVESNRSAIGARLRLEILEGGETRSIYRHVTSGGSFGASPLSQTIGLGQADRIVTLEVFWPKSGRTQVFRDVVLDQPIRIIEGEDAYAPLPLERLRLGAAAQE